MGCAQSKPAATDPRYLKELCEQAMALSNLQSNRLISLQFSTQKLQTLERLLNESESGADGKRRKNIGRMEKNRQSTAADLEKLKREIANLGQERDKKQKEIRDGLETAYVITYEKAMTEPSADERQKLVALEKALQQSVRPAGSTKFRDVWDDKSSKTVLVEVGDTVVCKTAQGAFSLGVVRAIESDEDYEVFVKDDTGAITKDASMLKRKRDDLSVMESCRLNHLQEMHQLVSKALGDGFFQAVQEIKDSKKLQVELQESTTMLSDAVRAAWLNHDGDYGQAVLRRLEVVGSLGDLITFASSLLESKFKVANYANYVKDFSKTDIPTFTEHLISIDGYFPGSNRLIGIRLVPRERKKSLNESVAFFIRNIIESVGLDHLIRRDFKDGQRSSFREEHRDAAEALLQSLAEQKLQPLTEQKLQPLATDQKPEVRREDTSKGKTDPAAQTVERASNAEADDASESLSTGELHVPEAIQLNQSRIEEKREQMLREASKLIFDFFDDETQGDLKQGGQTGGYTAKAQLRLALAVPRDDDTLLNGLKEDDFRMWMASLSQEDALAKMKHAQKWMLALLSRKEDATKIAEQLTEKIKIFEKESHNSAFCNEKLRALQKSLCRKVAPEMNRATKQLDEVYRSFKPTLLFELGVELQKMRLEKRLCQDRHPGNISSKDIRYLKWLREDDTTRDELVKLTEALKADFEKSRSTESKIDVSVADTKGFRRCFEKAIDDYDGDFAEIKDIHRASMIFQAKSPDQQLEDMIQMAKLLNEHAKKSDSPLVAINDFKHRLDPNYEAGRRTRDVLLTLVIGKKRRIVELQLHLYQVYRHKKETMHHIYKFARMLHIDDMTKVLGEWTGEISSNVQACVIKDLSLDYTAASAESDELKEKEFQQLLKGMEGQDFALEALAFHKCSVLNDENLKNLYESAGKGSCKSSLQGLSIRHPSVHNPGPLTNVSWKDLAESLPFLQVIEMDSHQITSEVKDVFEGLRSHLDAQGAHLTELKLTGNPLRGRLDQVDFTSLHSLREISLAFTTGIKGHEEAGGLCGEIPKSIKECKFNLRVLRLYRNNLEGELPKELGELKSLETLKLNRNKFKGDLGSCTWLGDLTNLQELLLYDNEFTGLVPKELNRLKHLRTFDASSCKLQGWENELISDEPPEANAPPEDWMPNLTTFEMSNNLLEVKHTRLPLKILCKHKRLKTVALSHAHLPSCLISSATSKMVMRLRTMDSAGASQEGGAVKPAGSTPPRMLRHKSNRDINIAPGAALGDMPEDLEQYGSTNFDEAQMITQLRTLMLHDKELLLNEVDDKGHVLLKGLVDKGYRGIYWNRVDVNAWSNEDPRLPMATPPKDQQVSLSCESRTDTAKSEEKLIDPAVEKIASKKDKKALKKAIQQTFPIFPPLFSREWQAISPEPQGAFTVLQFNMLAQGLSSGGIKHKVKTPFIEVDTERGNSYGNFDKCADFQLCLDWQVRKWRLLEVLFSKEVTASYDVIALQEVDHYHDFLSPVFELMGYGSVFRAKRKSPCLDLGWFSEGVALAWNKQRFTMLMTYSAEFADADANRARKKLEGSSGRVFVIALLLEKATGNPLLVATTHLVAGKDVKREWHRIALMRMLLQKIHSLHSVVRKQFDQDESGCDLQELLNALKGMHAPATARQTGGLAEEFFAEDVENLPTKKLQNPHLGTILLGDLNTSPYFKMAEETQKNAAPGAQPEGQSQALRKRNCVQNVLTDSSFAPESFQTSYRLEKDHREMRPSVRQDRPFDKQALHYTTWKHRPSKAEMKKGTKQARKKAEGAPEAGQGKSEELKLDTICEIEDYIFYLAPSLEVTAVLPEVDPEFMHKNLLPCWQYPSDHLAIAASFRFGAKPWSYYSKKPEEADLSA